MRIVIPGLSGGNPFFEEIAEYSKFQFDYVSWNEISTTNPAFILFQWPELIFDWKEPTVTELNELEGKILDWKKTASIIYLVHNEKRHFGMTPAFERLYKIVEKSADTMVHFGYYSCNLYKIKYPKKKHIVIQHPLYQNFFRRIPKGNARELLKIPKDRFVLVAPGKIRHLEERKLILKAFQYFNFNQKTLLVPSMLRKEVRLEFKGRNALKKIFDINDFLERKTNHSIPPSKYYNYGYNSPEQLSLYMSASDAVFLPRFNILNSGNLYLALTYGLPVCGPAVGNIEEVLKEFGMPVFDPGNSKSVKKAIKMLMTLLPKFDEFDKSKIEQFKPVNVAQKWDVLFENR